MDGVGERSQGPEEGPKIPVKKKRGRPKERKRVMERTGERTSQGFEGSLKIPVKKKERLKEKTRVMANNYYLSNQISKNF